MNHPDMMHPRQYPYLPTSSQIGEASLNFMTPSSDYHHDSHGQWISASSQSHTDWAESFSPPGNTFQIQIKLELNGVFI